MGESVEPAIVGARERFQETNRGHTATDGMHAIQRLTKEELKDSGESAKMGRLLMAGSIPFPGPITG